EMLTEQPRPVHPCKVTRRKMGSDDDHPPHAKGLEFASACTSSPHPRILIMISRPRRIGYKARGSADRLRVPGRRSSHKRLARWTQTPRGGAPKPACRNRSRTDALHFGGRCDLRYAWVCEYHSAEHLNPSRGPSSVPCRWRRKRPRN